VPLQEKFLLSLEEATELSGMARVLVERLAREGKVRAIKSGGWKISRRSLEAYCEGIAG
jgi:helix-turn-helix protein